MGGGNRGKRVSYAATRSGYEEAYEMDRPKRLDELHTEVKPTIFISRYVKGDEQKVNLLRYQAENSDKLEFDDNSQKTPFKSEWKKHVAERIKQADAVLVFVGKEAHSRRAVNWEIEKAHEMGKPVIGMKVHHNDKVPEAISEEDGDRVVPWKLDALQKGIEESVSYGNGG